MVHRYIPFQGQENSPPRSNPPNHKSPGKIIQLKSQVSFQGKRLSLDLPSTSPLFLADALIT